MPTELLRPCADELTADQRRERIVAILARAALRRIAVLRMVTAPGENKAIVPSPTLKLVPVSGQARVRGGNSGPL